jgi:PqqD family protein of HPr-rel-A system
MAGPLYIADSDPLAGASELEGLTLLFHDRSGTTHLLAPPAPQILEALAGEAGDVAAVIERISARFELESDDANAVVAARLEELEAVGLVWRP